MAQVNLRHADVTIEDGTAMTPQSVYLKIGEGNLTVTEQRPIKYTTDRNHLDEIFLEKPVPVEVKFDATWTKVGGPNTEHYADGTSTTSIYTDDILMNILKGVGYVSSDPDVERPHAVNIRIQYLTGGGASTTTMLIPNFRYEQASFDLGAGTISFTGKAFTTDVLLTEA